MQPILPPAFAGWDDQLVDPTLTVVLSRPRRINQPVAPYRSTRLRRRTRSGGAGTPNAANGAIAPGRLSINLMVPGLNRSEADIGSAPRTVSRPSAGRHRERFTSTQVRRHRRAAVVAGLATLAAVLIVLGPLLLAR